MAEHIERQALINQLSASCIPIDDHEISGLLGCSESIRDIINAMPAIDVAPVRHGEWFGTVCTACGESTSYYFNCDYCPNCGAKMDRETDQDNTGRDIKPNKDCSRCLAYNIDHCVAKECKGALIVLRHSQARQLPDEVIQKYYEYTLKNMGELKWK